jgi:hypothetical protein
VSDPLLTKYCGGGLLGSKRNPDRKLYQQTLGMMEGLEIVGRGMIFGLRIDANAVLFQVRDVRSLLRVLSIVWFPISY